MRDVKLVLWALLMGIVSITGCTTFQIPVQSFRQQLAGVNAASLQPVKVAGPYGLPIIYRANVNTLKTIRCVTANGRDVMVPNSPSIEVRISHQGKKTPSIFIGSTFKIAPSSEVNLRWSGKSGQTQGLNFPSS